MDAASSVAVRDIGALGRGQARRFDRIVIVSLIVEFIAAEPGMAERLLVQHVDDGTGHCRGCERTERGARDVWPCTFHTAVTTAVGLAEGRRR